MIASDIALVSLIFLFLAAGGAAVYWLRAGKPPTLSGSFHQVARFDSGGVFLWDADGRVIDANEAFLKTLRYSREDLCHGRIRWDELTPPGFEDHERRALDQLSRSGWCHPYRKEFFRKDGSRVPVLIAGTLLTGNTERGAGLILDLSLKAAETPA